METRYLQILPKWQMNNSIKKRNNSFLDKQLLHSLEQQISKSIENAKRHIYIFFLEFLKN